MASANIGTIGDPPRRRNAARRPLVRARTTKRRAVHDGEEGPRQRDRAKANAKAAKDGEKNPRKSSAAQAELGRKGGKAAAGKKG